MVFFASSPSKERKGQAALEYHGCKTTAKITTIH